MSDLKSNFPTPEALRAMPAADLYELQAELSAEMRRAMNAVDTVYSPILEAIGIAIADRFAPAVAAAYERAGKTHGKVRVDVDGGVSVVGDTSQRVEWDQNKLKALAATMDWPTAQHFFKIVFSVPEKVFNALPPDDPRKDALTAARTTKTGDTRIAFEKKDG